MSTTSRLVGFAMAAAVVFAAAVGLGKAFAPEADDNPSTGHDDHLAPADADAADYELHAYDTELPVGKQDLRFRITDHSGQPVTSYDLEHGKLLHLVVVRTDLGGYRHVHPTLDEKNGEWKVGLDLDAGPWRAYADFAPAGGEKVVATADLTVAGDVVTTELGADNDTDEVDGFEVHLTRADGMLDVHVTRGGTEVTDLQPYLGAYGHLVAIRADDLTYLHVHPQGGPAGPTVAFHADLGDSGRYRLFFEFRHGGVVHRAEFTVTADAAPAGGQSEEHDGGHDH